MLLEDRKELGYFEQKKLDFINTNYDNENTKLNYYRLFKMIVSVEFIFCKDVLYFNEEEIYICIEKLNEYSDRTYLLVSKLLIKYFKWGVSIGEIINIDLNKLKEVFELCQIKNRKSQKELLSYTKLISMIDDKTINRQDLVCIILPFYGVCGNDFDELIELTWNDIDFDKKIIYIKNRNKYIKMSDTLIRFFNELKNEKFYRVTTGKGRLKELSINNFVVKSSKTARSLDTIAPVGIRTRIKKVLTYVGFNEINVKFVMRSGQYYKLKERAKYKSLTDDDFKDINVMYGNEDSSSWFWIKEFYYETVESKTKSE